MALLQDGQLPSTCWPRATTDGLCNNGTGHAVYPQLSSVARSWPDLRPIEGVVYSLIEAARSRPIGAIGRGDMSHLATGQKWTYRVPAGFEGSRVVVGAILSFADRERIICCSVSGAPRRLPCGAVDLVTIPFLPMTERAFHATVECLDGTDDLPLGFAGALAEWSDDSRGLTTFTVPFEGFLDRMIAKQMAAIIERTAA